MAYQRLMAYFTVFAIAAGSFGLNGCSNSASDRKLRGQVVGGATGAAVGSLFGSGSGRAMAIGAGAVLGTVVGGKVAE
jgi:uncharacterized protein YcfJ